MKLEEIKEVIKKSWNWIWNSDSVYSWIIALILIFIIVKFIFFPTLSLIMGNFLPLAGVESSSMDHQIVKNDLGELNLCGNNYAKKEKINFDKYWETCGEWYEKRDIQKKDFSKFPMKNGFKKGDIIIVWGRFTPKIGDVIIFETNPESFAPHPIIHRVVSIENGIIQTKGDHNKEQLKIGNNPYKTDETLIKRDKVIGKAILKIPYLGWIKILATELVKNISNMF